MAARLRLDVVAWVLFSGLLLFGSLLFSDVAMWWIVVVSFLSVVLLTRNDPRWVTFFSALLILSIVWYVFWR